MKKAGLVVTLVLVLGLVSFAQDAGPAEAIQPIGDSALTVPAKGFREYPFTLESGLKNARLVGHFKATGGLHNTIVVCVMNDDQFANWRNGKVKAASNLIKPYFRGALYDSHEVTRGTIRVNLPSDAATYHIVFYNGYSVLTPKAVKATLTLKWARY
jgi:hypothetical protein